MSTMYSDAHPLPFCAVCLEYRVAAATVYFCPVCAEPKPPPRFAPPKPRMAKDPETRAEAC